jgi:hypothetical protein
LLSTQGDGVDLALSRPRVLPGRNGIFLRDTRGYRACCALTGRSRFIRSAILLESIKEINEARVFWVYDEGYKL